MGESSRRRAWAFAAMVGVLVVTHVFPWRPASDPSSWMLLGFLPWDLAYHLLWMVAATGGVLYMTEVVWQPPEDDPR